MTAYGLESMGVDELVRQFRDTAKLAGTAFTADTTPEKLKRTPERRALVEKMRALSAELRARRPMADIRALLNDPEVDVRGWAAPQFLLTDPEWASATFSGLIFELPAQEVFDLKRRALTPPPVRPPLGELTTVTLVKRFEDAATREYATRFVTKDDPSDMTLYNRIHGEVLALMREFKRRNELAQLLPLLDSQNITVRAEAARATLTVAPERASAVLEAIVAGDDRWERIRAADSLENWRKGETVVYGVG